MKPLVVALVADVHLGNHGRFGGPRVCGMNRRCRLALDALERSVEMARKRGAAAFVVLGDLFDDVRPAPQLVADVQTILKNAPRPIVLRGNHEAASEQPGDSSLAPLQHHVTLVESPAAIDLGRGASLLALPFRAGAAADWIPGELKRLRDQAKGDVLAGFHVGLVDTDSPPFLRGDDAIGVDDLAAALHGAGIEWGAAGNHHVQRSWSLKVGHALVGLHQNGSLAPTGFDDEGLDHHGWMAFWSPTLGFERARVAGPRFLRVGSEADLLAAISRLDLQDRLHVEWTASASTVTAARERLGELLTSHRGRLVDGEVLADREESERAARAAASAASAAETTEAALAAFVAKMELEEGVVRAGVLALARRYLEGS